MCLARELSQNFKVTKRLKAAFHKWFIVKDFSFLYRLFSTIYILATQALLDAHHCPNVLVLTTIILLNSQCSLDCDMCECMGPRDDWLQVSSAPLSLRTQYPLSEPESPRWGLRPTRPCSGVWLNVCSEISDHWSSRASLWENELIGQSSLWDIGIYIIKTNSSPSLCSLTYEFCLVTSHSFQHCCCWPFTKHKKAGKKLISFPSSFLFNLTIYSDISKALNSIQNVNELKVDQPICFLFRKKLLWKDIVSTKKIRSHIGQTLKYLVSEFCYAFLSGYVNCFTRFR